MQRQFGLPRARTTGTSPCLSSATELLSADTASYQRMVLFLLVMVFVPFGIEVWTTIDNQRRPSTTIDDQRRPSTTIDDHRRPTTTNDDQRQPSTTIDNYRRPSTTNDDHRRPTKTNEDDESPSEFQITVLPFSNDERPSRPFRSGQRRAWQICGGMCQDQSTLIVHGHPRFDS